MPPDQIALLELIVHVSHRYGSFEHPNHIFILIDKKPLSLLRSKMSLSMYM